MEVTRAISSLRVPVAESSQIGEARRTAVALCRELGFTEEQEGRVALVTTELATNLVHHSGNEGEIIVGPSRGGSAADVLAVDRGPGIPDICKCLQDGYSTAGTAGHGLGAVRRVATAFDVHSTPGKGTVVFARVGQSADREKFELGAVCLYKSGQEVCGDSWDVQPRPEGVAILVADGLGHGFGAAEASRAAVDAFAHADSHEPRECLNTIHAALRSTRGAAAAIAEVSFRRGLVRYAGIGNIAGSIVQGGATRALISYNGILGHQIHKFQELTYPWEAGSLLVMHSDGVKTHWDLEAYPGFTNRHPAVIAGLIYRDHLRHHDDATIVVMREVRV